MSVNGWLFFGLLASLIAIVASSSLKSLLTEHELVFAADGDSGGSGGGGGGSGGGDGGGGGDGNGGDGNGGNGGGGHHSHHRHHSRGGGAVPTTSATAPTVSTSRSSGFSFKEVLEISPSLRGIVMTGPTNKFVDSVGTLHIVGELRDDATRTLTANQIVATIYGLNNQTLGLDYATPTPDTLSPGKRIL